MRKIVFFCIPAHGHTNPTIPVVEELINRGHEVWYYSFLPFKDRIEATGAKFIPCDAFLPPISEEEIEKKAGKDFAALIEMVADTTIALDEKVCKELKEFQPDCIVSDSLAFWGKLFARKLGIKYICSTTTFAFNEFSAKLMKPGLREMLRMITGMPRINKKMQLLREHGYDVKNFVSIIQNDNDTDTIVYTSKELQPMAETFSEKYSFVGPSIKGTSIEVEKRNNKKVIYISLGTVLNQNEHFYQSCLKAFKDSDYEVIMSVGENTNIETFGRLPENFIVQNSVDQIEVLQKSDVFITHCGMNSASEGLYFGVPMVLFPQHSEQRVVADRVAEVGAGVLLKRSKPQNLSASVAEVLLNQNYQKNARKIAESFLKSGGAIEAANVIEAKCEK